jgi:hypothetical protein
VRIQAEAGRQRAFAVVAQAMAEYDAIPAPSVLQSIDPTLTWVNGDQSSTSHKEVSVGSQGSAIIVAVATGNKQVCAYGRLPVDGVGEYVTVGNTSTCRANDAPSQGWTQLAGIGGGSQMPPEGY